VVDIFLGPSLREYYAAHPLTLIDIGARGGLQPNWKPARPHLRVIGFEPDPEEYARLVRTNDPRKTLYINTALHRELAELTLNSGRDGGTSSLLKPNWDYLNRFPDPGRYEVVQRVAVKVDALDRVLPSHDVRDPDFIKIDTQGAELAILEGGRTTLAEKVFGIELEVLFGPLYIGQPRFGQLDDLLGELGFQLMDLRPSYWKRASGARYGGPKGQLAFADALYFKTEQRFQRVLDAIADLTQRRAKLLRALSVSLLYGYVDYAIELFRPNRDLFESSVAAEISHQLQSDVRFSTRLPHFRGRGFLSHLFYRLHRLFFPTLGGWASGGRHLGNLD
jgi:FkbM family methyltransferase